MNLRRYEVRFFHYSRRLLKSEKTVVSLDLETGPGLQHAHFYMDQLMGRLAQAAGLRTGDLKDCRVEAVDEETGKSLWFYPPTQ